MPHEQSLADRWSERWESVQKSRERIDLCGKVRRREIRPSIPKNFFGVEGVSTFEVMLPAQTLMGQDVVNFLGRKRPVAKREATWGDVGPARQRLDSKIEVHVQEAMDEQLKANMEDLWEAFLAHAANDGEWAVLVQPRVSHWANLLDYLEDGDEDDANRPIRVQFRRNARGDEPYRQDPETKEWLNEDDSRFEVDEDQSKKAFERYRTAMRLKRLPVVVRLIPGPMCIPDSVDPETGKVDGLMVRTSRTASSLRRDGFRFVALSSEQDPPGGAEPNGGTLIDLYEYHTGGRIQYELVGPGNQHYRTSMVDAEDKEHEATIDLEATYGITEVMGGYYYGAHFANETDLDKKGYPYLWPFIEILLGMNQMASDQVAYANRFAYQGPLVEVDKDLLEVWTQRRLPMDIKLKPMEATLIPGKVSPGMNMGSGPDVERFLSLALAMLAQGGPSEDIRGDAQAGGFAQAVSLSSAETMLRQILEGATRCWKRTAECYLEVTSAIARATGEAIPVRVTINPQKRKDPRYNQFLLQEHVALGAEDCKGDYTLQVFFPVKRGQNMALAQAMGGWHDAGKIPLRMWLEDGLGEEQPEQVMDELEVEQMLRSEIGVRRIWEIAWKIKGHQDMARIVAMQNKGQIDPSGLPMDVVPQVRPPGMEPQAAAAVQGPGTGNMAASQLGGIVAGPGMQAAQAPVVAATGEAAPVAL